MVMFYLQIVCFHTSQFVLIHTKSHSTYVFSGNQFFWILLKSALCASDLPGKCEKELYFALLCFIWTDGTSKGTCISDSPLMSDAQQREKLEISWLGAFLTFHALIVSSMWGWTVSFSAHHQKTSQPLVHWESIQQCNSRDCLGLSMLSTCQGFGNCTQIQPLYWYRHASLYLSLIFTNSDSLYPFWSRSR